MRFTLAVSILLCAAAPAAAQLSTTISPARPLVQEFFGGKPFPAESQQLPGSFRFRWDTWYTGMVAELKVDEKSKNLKGSTIDVTEDLGIEGSQHVQHFHVLVGSPAFDIDFAYRRHVYDGRRVLGRDLNFDDHTFNTGEPVFSQISWEVYSIGGSFSIFRRPFGARGGPLANLDLGFRFGTNVYNVRGAVESLTNGSRRAEKEFDFPVPTPGLNAELLLFRYVTLAAHASYFRVSVADRRVEYSFLDFRVQFNLNRYVGLFAGWRQEKVRLRVDESSQEEHFANLRINGFFLGAQAGF